MYSSEQVANLIENEVFLEFIKVYEISWNNCKNNKDYREKIEIILHNRLVGNKNNLVRDALKSGQLTV